MKTAPQYVTRSLETDIISCLKLPEIIAVQAPDNAESKVLSSKESWPRGPGFGLPLEGDVLP